LPKKGLSEGKVFSSLDEILQWLQRKGSIAHFSAWAGLAGSSVGSPIRFVVWPDKKQDRSGFSIMEYDPVFQVDANWYATTAEALGIKAGMIAAS
jgi:hypothetical protein